MTGEKCRLNEVVISIESLHSVIEINSLFCFAQTLLVTLAAPKLLTLGKMKEKQCFPFILRSFIRNFAPMKKYSSQKVGEYTHYEVRKEQPLLEYLLETIEGQSRSKIKATLQGRGIKVDGKVVTQFDFPLRPGMKVAVSKTKRNDRFKSRYVKIVYEDRHLVVVEKEIGILSMAAGHASLNVKAVLDKYFAQTRQKCRAHVVHRLDRDTSGLMVYAKDMETEQILEHNWHDIVFDRRYVAVVSVVARRQWREICGHAFPYPGTNHRPLALGVQTGNGTEKPDSCACCRYGASCVRRCQIRQRRRPLAPPLSACLYAVLLPSHYR